MPPLYKRPQYKTSIEVLAMDYQVIFNCSEFILRTTYSAVSYE